MCRSASVYDGVPSAVLCVRISLPTEEMPLMMKVE